MQRLEVVRTTSLALGGVVIALLIWLASEAFLILFAGVLFGVLLDASVRSLGYVLPLGRGWLLGIACLIFFSVLAVAITIGGLYFVQEFDSVRRLISAQLTNLHEQAAKLGILPGASGTVDAGGGLRNFLFSDPGAMVGSATTALATVSGVMFNAIIIAIIGIFAAASPILYRDGFLRLFPMDMRARLRETLNSIGEALRWWLVGQIAAMILIGVSITVALVLMGVPAPFLLGFQAGLLGFIPFIGPIIAAVPIMLTAMTLGMETALMVLIVYTIIQSIEGYLLTPLIQERAVHLPPLLTIAAILIFGALFGEVSVALATPFVAIARLAVLELYVEPVIEKPQMPS
ncbi:MAG: AI-2E family transporter [Beijerinckiaceae bacterium]|nr:AI-2E family transporter [Beijerinckiaceae bacterium]